MVRSIYLLFGALVLASPLTFAQSSGGHTYDLGPSDYRNLGSGSNPRIDGNRLITSNPQTINTRNGPLTVTRNPSLSLPSLSSSLKNIVRTTPQAALGTAAITGLFLGLDWLFDNSDMQWKKQGENVISPPDDSHIRWVVSGAPHLFHSDPTVACQMSIDHWNSIQMPGWSATYTDLVFTASTQASCYGIRTFNNTHNFGRMGHGQINRQGSTCPVGYTYDGEYRACVKPQGLIPLTESDISKIDQKVPSLTPSELQTLGSETMDIAGPQSVGFGDSTITGPASVSADGPTVTTTNDSGTTTSITTNNYHYSYGDTTVTHTHTTSITNTYQNGNLTETTTTETPQTPSATPAPPAPVIPTDCEFMPTVCAWLEWFKTPFEPPADDEMPVIEDQDFERNYTFNLAASCPAPYTINLTLFPPVQFQWDPFCDFAVMIRPLVVGSAALFSAFIVLGIGRGRG